MRSLKNSWIVLVFSLCLLHFNGETVAQTKVYSIDELPNDRRLGPLTDLNGYFPFQVPDSVQDWKSRSSHLRNQVLLSTGLWPQLPPRTPMNPVLHGKVERDGFTVEKVYFESLPNHFVTGLLFRPSDVSTGPRPAVLCPHGHGGRMQDYGADKMSALIASGAEVFERSGRFPKIARCAHLARMGCVVFIYDMLGYEDSQQISYELAHRFAKRRPEFEGSGNWGFYSAQAEMRLQSIMGLQTWNSIRCLDFLQELPDVDPKRIGVTGGSGGGTQTILLCAVDPRPITAFPNGMVSTAMQGGCTCENCSLLRVGTGNVELAALFAPKPQAMTAADDWTKDMMTKGYPELRRLYGMLGAEESVYCRPLLHFPHNYNHVSRTTMYRWFAKHLALGDVSIEERDFEPLTAEEAAVWNDEHPRPEGGDKYERALTKQLAKIADSQFNELIPHNKDSFLRFESTVATALQVLVGRQLPASSDLERIKVEKTELEEYFLFKDKLRNNEYGEEIPLLSLYPKQVEWSGDVVVWLDEKGKKALFQKSGELQPEVNNLLRQGAAIVSPDLFMQGEFLTNESQGNQVLRQRSVPNPREAPCYTYCYNQPLFVKRVHDVLSVLAFVQSDMHEPSRISMLAVGKVAPMAIAARALTKDTVANLAVDTQGFRFENITDYLDPSFLPGAIRIGDLPGLLALSAPLPIQLCGESELPALTAQAYDALQARSNISVKDSIDIDQLLMD